MTWFLGAEQVDGVFYRSASHWGLMPVAAETLKDSRLDMPILDFIEAAELNYRTSNCLRLEFHWGNLKTLGDLINATDSQLKKIPNFGKVSLADLRGEIAYYMEKTK